MTTATGMTTEAGTTKDSPADDKQPKEEETQDTKAEDTDKKDGNDNDDADDDDDDDSAKESIESDESSFHASDYEDEAGYDPELDRKELIATASGHKDEGNNFFKAGDLVRASRAYKKGASVLKALKEDTAAADADDNHEEKDDNKDTDTSKATANAIDGNENDNSDKDGAPLSQLDEEIKTLLVSLQTNLSMCCLKQNKPKLSLDVASKAIETDPTNVKAYYRRAMAHKKLGDLQAAKRDLKEAVRLDPKNGAAKKELHAIVKYLTDTAKREKKAMKSAFSFSKGKTNFLYEDVVDAERVKAEEEKRRKKELEARMKERKEQWMDECVKRMAKNESAISYDDWEKEQQKKEDKERREKQRKQLQKKRELEKKAEEARKKEAEKDNAIDEELSEQELSQLRGYKKTKDGRITSYFTREQSEKDKQLLAETLVPKKLASGEAALPSGPARLASSSSSSAWNAAGTWEEKDTTGWCTAQLRSRLLAASSSEGSCFATVTDVDDLKGDASVAFAGNKKRYIFDFSATLKYEVRNEDGGEAIATGSLHLPDINSTSHEEAEVNYSSWSKAPAAKYERDALACREALMAGVRSSVVYFVSDFNEQYS